MRFRLSSGQRIGTHADAALIGDLAARAVPFDYIAADIAQGADQVVRMPLCRQ